MKYYTEEEAIQRLQQVMNRQFNDEQLAILRTPGGISIAAVAGSGKTTTLVALIAKRLLTGEIPDPTKLLITTFSKVGADELGERLNNLLMSVGLPGVNVTTLHATCYNILEHFGVYPRIMDQSEHYKIISTAVNNAMCKKVYLEQEVIENIESSISILDNSLISIEDLMVSGKYLLQDYYDRTQFENIVNAYRYEKQQSGKHTFDDLLVGVYQWLCIAKSDVVLDYVRQRYHYLFLDEFQDTNNVQFEIIKAILNLDANAWPEKRLVVVGDDDQNIYEWRGTDPRIMINIRSIVDVKKMTLSTNYRCRSNISSVAMNCVKNMGTRQDKQMISPINNKGGIVELLDPAEYKPSIQYRTDLANYSQLLADRLLVDIKNGTIKQRRTCILARTNIEVALLANILLRNNYYVRQISSMCISRNRVWTAFKQIIQLAKPFNGSYRLQSLLWQLIPYTSNKIEYLINDISNCCQCSIDYAVEYLLRITVYARVQNVYNRSDFDSSIANDYLPLNSTDTLNDYITKGNKKYAGKGVYAIDPRISASAEYTMSRYKSPDLLIDFINALRAEQPLKPLLKLWYSCMSDEQGRLAMAFKDYLSNIAEQYNYSLSDIERYINYTEQAENCSYKAVHDNYIEIRTIHGSKGMEWPIVYILADDNNSFPDFRKLNALSNMQGVKDETIMNVIDSERRLHYVAQTRAKDELYFICDKKKASVFLEETFGYVYQPPKDAFTLAQLRNRGINNENGRIIWKVEHDQIKADALPNETCIKA